MFIFLLFYFVTRNVIFLATSAMASNLLMGYIHPPIMILYLL